MSLQKACVFEDILDEKILCNGPGTCIPICAIAFIFKFSTDPNDAEGNENECGTIASESEVQTLRFSLRVESISPDFVGGGDCGGATDGVAVGLHVCCPRYVISNTMGSSSALCTCFLAMH
ncbi:hypothetical protein M8C21_015773 [Ambrosia artemisiifolia]|uniref:Uncharacterized protein n=1 Tax=Ambrosia artemisiifolia TaxID=4212 RepID=A0AAD5GNX0_AMBAR|nr:hypothetical protein M8C21_015773 [Ambrosia artemisiifolia]